LEREALFEGRRSLFGACARLFEVPRGTVSIESSMSDAKRRAWQLAPKHRF
jgi:hypothetical protein